MNLHECIKRCVRLEVCSEDGCVENRPDTTKKAFPRFESDTGIPIGSIFYFGSKPLPYRWKSHTSISETLKHEEDIFEVHFGGRWLVAQSIDWNF